jgi:Zinc finger, C3HC4 type (RING finger)
VARISPPCTDFARCGLREIYTRKRGRECVVIEGHLIDTTGWPIGREITVSFGCREGCVVKENKQTVSVIGSWSKFSFRNVMCVRSLPHSAIKNISFKYPQVEDVLQKTLTDGKNVLSRLATKLASNLLVSNLLTSSRTGEATEEKMRLGTYCECVVCLKAESVGHFVPCTHQCCCSTCGAPLRKCPVCGTTGELLRISYLDQSRRIFL